MYVNYIKPLLDFFGSFLLLILLSPLMAIIIFLLAITQKGRVFFLQSRPGFKGHTFKLIKFKTMHDNRDSYGNLLPDMQRLHPLGRWLRKTSLDELPQLINILSGDMSFIGPRPLLVQYMPLYNDFQMRRHKVRPGITGWAQVNGRNAITWEQKFDLDIWYVDHQSFAVDAKIFFMTLKKLFRTSQVNASEDTTMEPFRGNN